MTTQNTQPIKVLTSLRKVTSFPLLVFAILADLWLFVNGSTLFGSEWGSYQQILLYYIILISATLLLANNSKQLKISLQTAFIFFVPTFMVTVIAISSIMNYSGSTTFTQVIIVLVTQILVVSLSEEMMFRGIIINYVGVIPQGILFGLFHTAAYYSIYGLNIPAMLSAMVLGIAFGYVVKTFPKRGIAVTWGVHAAWNIAILIPIFSLHFLL